MNYIQLSLDLPGYQIRPNTRMLILPPHREAGKTGRINMRFGSDYLINLRGQVTSCHRSELEIIDKRRGFRQRLCIAMEQFWSVRKIKVLKPL